MEKLQLRSQIFMNNRPIPQVFTCDRTSISPQLSWQNPPQETQSFVLIMEDPNAPRGTWYHWVVFNIPAHVRDVPEAVQYLPEGTKVGENSWGQENDGGPCLLVKRSVIFLNLYALDCSLNLDHGAGYEALKKAMDRHLLDHAQLMGRYTR